MPKWGQAGTGAILARTARKRLFKEIAFEQNLEGWERVVKKRSGDSALVRGNSRGKGWEVGRAGHTQVSVVGWQMTVNKGIMEGEKIRDWPSGGVIPRHGREAGFILNVVRVPEGEHHALIYWAPVTDWHCAKAWGQSIKGRSNSWVGNR